MPTLRRLLVTAAAGLALLTAGVAFGQDRTDLFETPTSLSVPLMPG